MRISRRLLVQEDLASDVICGSLLLLLLHVVIPSFIRPRCVVIVVTPVHEVHVGGKTLDMRVIVTMERY